MKRWMLVAAAVLLWAGGAAATESGGDANVPQGFGRLMRAAEDGQGQAQYALGMLFLTGRVVSQDDVTAAYWLGRAADADIGPAESNLGLLYLEGRGVPRDPRRAAELLQRAAAKNVVAAQHNLGWMAQVGEGTARDPEAAVHWYAAAAQAGYSQSQYNLGVILAEDDGHKDMAGAVKWLSLAGLSPNADVRQRAVERLMHLSREAPDTAIGDGLQEARHWLATGRVY